MLESNGLFGIVGPVQPIIDHQDISRVLSIAEIKNFTGSFLLLGGGEVNYTYSLDCGDQKLILRVAKDEDQRTLITEARALSQLDSPHIPKLVFFDENNLVKNRMWILESYVPGSTVDRLTPEQFNGLGKLLAKTHQVCSADKKVNLKDSFLDSCKAFADEHVLLNHPNPRLRQLIQDAYEEFEQQQPFYDSITPSLIHSDATPSNILVNEDSVSLIDWEFSKFNDPMADFSTIYYEDIVYNQGKWRIKIRQDEKDALFSGYESAGGSIDEKRIRYWTKLDKLGAAVFLYWRLHESSRSTTESETKQYNLDFNNLISSISSK